MRVHASHGATALLIARAQTGAAHSILQAIRNADREAHRDCRRSPAGDTVVLSHQAQIQVRTGYCVAKQIILARQATTRVDRDTVFVPVAPELTHRCDDRKASPLKTPWQQPLAQRQITHAPRSVVKKYLSASDSHQKGAMLDVFC